MYATFLILRTLIIPLQPTATLIPISILSGSSVGHPGHFRLTSVTFSGANPIVDGAEDMINKLHQLINIKPTATCYDTTAGFYF